MFEDHPIFRMDTNVLGRILGFEKRIKPRLSEGRFQEISKLTQSVLDSTNQIYLGMYEEDFNLQAFNCICDDFKANDDNPEWSCNNISNDKIKDLYNAVAIHNTRHQINLNHSRYKNDNIVSYLSGISASCVLFLDRERKLLSDRKVRFNLNSQKDSSENTTNTPSPTALSPSTSDSSPESEKSKGGRS